MLSSGARPHGWTEHARWYITGADDGAGGEGEEAWCFLTQEETIESAVDAPSYLGAACHVSRVMFVGRNAQCMRE